VFLVYVIQTPIMTSKKEPIKIIFRQIPIFSKVIIICLIINI
jgi:hypothetical protein